MLSVEYFYSHKVGHVAADCFTLKCKQEHQEKGQGLDNRQPKGVGFVKTVSQASLESTDECCKPFISHGVLSVVHTEGEEQDSIILHDTGAA